MLSRSSEPDDYREWLDSAPLPKEVLDGVQTVSWLGDRRARVRLAGKRRAILRQWMAMGLSLRRVRECGRGYDAAADGTSNHTAGEAARNIWVRGVNDADCWGAERCSTAA